MIPDQLGNVSQVVEILGLASLSVMAVDATTQWLRAQRQTTLDKLSENSTDQDRLRAAYLKFQQRALDPDLSPVASLPAPPLRQVSVAVRKAIGVTAHSEAERKHFGERLFEVACESGDALEDANELHQEFVHSVVMGRAHAPNASAVVSFSESKALPLRVPAFERISGHMTRLGRGASEGLRLEEAIRHSDFLQFKFVILPPLVEQAKLLLRGKTDLISAAARGSTAAIILSVAATFGKFLGTVVGALGGPAGAISGGTVCAFLFARGAGSLIRLYYRLSIKRAIAQFNAHSEGTRKALRKKKLEALRVIRIFRKVANEKWRADWDRVIGHFNSKIANLQCAYDAGLDALFGIVTPELQRLERAIADGSKRREILATLSRTQRASFWIFPNLRRQLHLRLMQDGMAIGSLRKDLSTAADNQSRLALMIAWLIDHPIASATIERALSEFENVRQHVCARIESARDRMVRRLGLCAFARSVRSQRRQEAESARWEPVLKAYETGLQTCRAGLFTKAGRAGIDIVLAPVPT